ncbi:type I secretion system permease/ATPase [Novispirillum sp. DQ9]|uniref:type I secretion system permease/ATPase n=1 Tax=Novispirillum sp. DQ9 TaxID=3398612 RepID=UPI003C7A699E
MPPQPATPLDQAVRAARPVLWRIGAISLCVNLLMLTGPLYMMQVFDRVLGSGHVETLLLLTALALVALLAMGLLEVARGQVLGRLGRWLDGALGAPLLGLVLRRAAADRPAGTQPLHDLAAVRGFLAGPGVLALLDAPWVPVFLAVIWVLHPLLGLVALAAAVLLLTVAVTAEVLTRRPQEDAAEASRAAGRLAEATLRNADAARALGMEGAVLARWGRLRGAAGDSQVTVSDRGAGLVGLSKFLRAAVQIVILGAGAWLVLDGALTAGGMIAASILLGRALAPVEQAIGTWRGVVAARAAWGRLRALTDAAPPPGERMTLPAPRGTLACQGVVHVPPGREDAVLKGVDFTLEAGKVLGIIGPSAAGKSTLCRILVGAAKPTRGHARLDGADIFAWADGDLGRHVGYLPQEVELFPGTVRETIARFDPDADPEAVVEAARAAGVHEMILALPDGYDSDIGDGGRLLSGGQRQRLGLARALYGRPRLIVLDEPSSNLDGEGEQALLAAIATARDAWGASVVMVAHGLRVLRVADMLMVLRGGVVEMMGARDEVLAALRPAAVTTTEAGSLMAGQRKWEAS